MNGPDPARETAREDPLGQRVARLLGYYGVDVQGGNLAPDRHVCDELLAIGNEAAELRAQLTAARARAERAEGALAKRVGEVRAAGLLAYRKAKGEACRLDFQVRCYSCEREYNEVVDGILAALAARGE